jgi:hypothetical protein
MKKGVKLKINLSNRLLYTFISLGILILLSVGVYAYQITGTATPSIMGHTSNEINFAAIDSISSGEVVSINTNTNNPSIELRDTDGTGLTPFIDFSNDANIDYDARFILAGDDFLSLEGVYFGVTPSDEGHYAQTSMHRWGLASEGDIFIEPAPGKTLSLTDQWSRTGTLSIQFGSVVSHSGISAPAFIYSSDRSLKTNILPLANSLEKVKQLEGISFNWKESGDESIGLIAQDVEKVFPELVSGEEGSKAVEYGNLVAVLIEAVKEQDKKIDSLQKQIDELKSN